MEKLEKFKPINFNEIDTNVFNDSNSIVATAMTMEYSEESLRDLEEGLQEIGLIKPDKHLIDCRYIQGNVRGDGRFGDDARVDHLLIFDNPNSEFNPLIRLRFKFMKWTSDFVVNYREDYNE